MTWVESWNPSWEYAQEGRDKWTNAGHLAIRSSSFPCCTTQPESKAAKYTETRIARNGKAGDWSFVWTLFQPTEALMLQAYTAAEFRDYYIDYLGEAWNLRHLVKTKRSMISWVVGIVSKFRIFVFPASWKLQSPKETHMNLGGGHGPWISDPVAPPSATGGLGEGVVQLQRGDPARGWIISH